MAICIPAMSPPSIGERSTATHATIASASTAAYVVRAAGSRDAGVFTTAASAPLGEGEHVRQAGLRGDTAIDDERRASDERRLPGREKQHGVRDLVRAP